MQTIKRFLYTKKYFNGEDLVMSDYFLIIILNEKNEEIKRTITESNTIVIA